MVDEPDTRDIPAEKVVVLGGGLSGLSTALRLIDLGFDVTLVDKRPFLGGRAFSFVDPREQVEVDNGQHVFLGCFKYYLDYLDKIGSWDKAYLQKKLRIEVVRDGKSGMLASALWLRRLHLLPSFVAYPHLGVKDKLLVAYGLLRVLLTDRAGRSAELDGESAYDWLRRHHQTERAIKNLWNVIILPTLNDDVRDVSADMAIMVFQESLLKGPSDAAIGLSRVGLTSLNGDPARRVLEQRRAHTILSRTVRSLRVEGGRIRGVELSDGHVLESDWYVSALPFAALLQTLPGEVGDDDFFSKVTALRSSPIVGIHLWYDRAIMDQDFVAFLDSPVQFVFNKSLIQGMRGPGQYVCISLSGAWKFADRPKDELAEQFIAEMARLFPRARQARVERALIVKEPQATFSSAPGAAGNRLPQVTPIQNLFLAGEWTDTGWPSTMESAVRSGVLAADKVAAASKARLRPSMTTARERI
jgi:squalene-associated FAD-dependent desaturase